MSSRELIIGYMFYVLLPLWLLAGIAAEMRAM
jgi:hypothetical protein